MSILENGYGISLRFLLQFAVNTYSDKNVDDAVYKAISVILFKLEGSLLRDTQNTEWKEDFCWIR